MENEQHPDTFQPTENRYSDLEEETFRRGNRFDQRIYFNG